MECFWVVLKTGSSKVGSGSEHSLLAKQAVKKKKPAIRVQPIEMTDSETYRELVRFVKKLDSRQKFANSRSVAES